MRITLLTPFSPETGGGAAQLRAHLRYLPDLKVPASDVQWNYLAARPAASSETGWKWLGERLTSAELLSDLSARTGLLPGSKSRVRRLVEQLDADLYWVVGHYEGISLACELIAQGRKVHLTVHDDPFGTWTRSQRYSLFRPLLRATYPRLLRAAQGVDVTSWGLRNLYRQKYGVKCFSLYLHVAKLPALDAKPDPSLLSIGHIGTLYQVEPFRRFVHACREVAAENNRRLRIIRVGASPQFDTVAAEYRDLFESHADLHEARAIPLLASCDFCYAMYPPGKKYELFRRTSLPIKLSTYIQSQRPIFAHTPEDSTLACAVKKYRVGCVSSGESEREIAADVRRLLEAHIPFEHFEAARSELLGLTQVRQLAAALRGQDWQAFPEADCP